MGKALFRRSSRPIQLTAGPLSYSGVSVSRDGKQVFAIGTMQRGELVRYDMKSHQFVPFLSGISATIPTFSRDGQWVAYDSYPDQSLWRSRSDGSEKMRLTYPPMGRHVPHISPDGTKVAFTSTGTDDLMVVDMNGTLPPKTVAKHEGEFYWQARNWSPDGNLLLIYIRGELAIYDMRTGERSVVPSSKDIWGYWIDQNSILGLSPDNTKFLTFDLRTQKWTDLADSWHDRPGRSRRTEVCLLRDRRRRTEGLAVAICRSQDRDAYEHEGTEPGAEFGMGRRHRRCAGWLADLHPEHRHRGNLCAECPLAEVIRALRNGAAPVYWMML